MALKHHLPSDERWPSRLRQIETTIINLIAPANSPNGYHLLSSIY
jgi:hypothetical protein